MSWWSNATEAQRLAQIDGGIECGMTGPMIALASGTTRNAVNACAWRNGRSLPGPTKQLSHNKKRAAEMLRDRAAFARGERIDLWGNTEPQDEFALDEVEA